ncbi:MAG: S-layer homology domain-containing protein, partial [Eubacterium sp.]|nr:S-layer homology domain-containing protein [Eubacterium sp.]
SETEDKTSNTIDYKVRLNTKKTLSVTVEANDKEGITYRWGKGTMPDAPGEILGTGSSYTALYTEEFGVYYYCVVTDKYGNFEYCFFHLTTDNEFKAYPSDSKDHSDSITYTVDRKGSKTLSIGVDAINKTGISYHWYDNDNREISGATGSSYTLNNIEEPVTYSCRVYDRYGNKVNVYFQINIKNDIFKYLEENTVTEKTYLVNKGDPVTLDIGVNASDLNGIKITWHSARLGATAAWVKISTDTTSVKTKSIDDDYIILCVLSDDYGNRLAYIFNVFIKKFDDVPAEAGYTPSVYWALNKGITAGKTSSLFDPKGGCTRAQFVTFLWRYAGSPEPTKHHTFSDVPASKSYYKAIMWAAEKGITAGLSGRRAGQFGPNDVCTREQCVAFMYRFDESPKVTAADHSSISFSDVSPESYYYDAITWAAKNGITAGISSTKFGVGKDCTRSQMVSFLNRYYYYTNPAYDPHIY